MKSLNKLISDTNISKVKLAKYLGVSRQMIYNYLQMESVDKWPQDKKKLLLTLFGLKNGTDSEIESIDISFKYINEVESRLNQNIKDPNVPIFDVKSLNREEQDLLNDIVFLVKEKFCDDKNKYTYKTFLYLYHVLQSIDNVPEIKYVFAYLSKKTGFTNPNEFAFDENRQFIIESILYTAFNLYNNGGASKTRLIESHNRFVQEIENIKDEQLSRTQKLNTNKIQALKELGYTEITKENASEIFAKIAEIQSRKV